MAGITLKHQIDFHRFGVLLESLQDLDRHAMLDDIGAYLNSETARRFKQGQDWQGDDLIPSQRALNSGGMTLVDKGHLRDSYTYNVGFDSVEHGSPMIYSAIHHLGGETGRGHSTVLPARPVMGINDDDENEIQAIIEQHLNEARDV